MKYANISAKRVIKLHDALDEIFEALPAEDAARDDIKNQRAEVRTALLNAYPISILRKLDKEDCEAFAAALASAKQGPFNVPHRAERKDLYEYLSFMSANPWIFEES